MLYKNLWIPTMVYGMVIKHSPSVDHGTNGYIMLYVYIYIHDVYIYIYT